MSWLHGLRHRLRSVIDPAGYERELQDEMRFHVELDAMQQRDADAARRRFGNRTYYQEETRRMTWLASFDVLRQDLGYAWRSVRRAPAFTAMVVGTLALGLGVNAATFSVLDRIFLRPPEGVVDPATVHRLWFETSAMRSYDGKSFMMPASSYAEFRDVADASSKPGNFALYDTDFALTLRQGDSKSRIRAAFATATYFPVLGVRAAIGRVYGPAEDSVGHASPVAVVSHRYWRTTLGGDSAIIGRKLNIERNDYTVVGVMQPNFAGLDLQAVDIWLPLAARPNMPERWWTKMSVNGMQGFYRAANSERDLAFEQMATLAHRGTERRLNPQYADTLARVLTDPIHGGGDIGEPGKDTILSSRLWIVASIILVIACANVINLLLSRAERRKREIAVRLALGISRARLVRLLTTETVLLALLASAVALLAAWWGGTVLRSQLLPETTFYESVLHWRVVVFAFGISLLAGLVAGIIPALQASNPRLANALKDGTRTSSSRRSRLRSSLVAMQAALSVVLLVGAALFVRSMQNVKGLDIGYDAERLLFGYVRFEPGQSPPPAVGNARMVELQGQLRQRPGIEGVARSSMVPMQGISFENFWWDSDSAASLSPNGPTYIAVDANYFRTVGMSFVAGSTFEDRAQGAREVIINEVMAQRLWPNVSPLSVLGRCIRFATRDAPCYSVAGVVETGRQSYVVEKDAVPLYYLPLGNLPTPQTYRGALVVRAAPDAELPARQELMRELARAFPGGEVTVQAMTETLEPEYRPWVLGVRLFSAFGLLALVVAMIGIYSTTSYGVTQRTHEFGVRVALGARLQDVARQVVGEGVRVVAVGVLTGIALALAAGRLIASLLYGVEPSDPAVMIVVSAILLLVAAAAAVIPAWRAARVDPVTALRAD
ncbi:MAG TPA: ADOP family duplicated permease [Gemmatimonadaceae bacterium]|nr:ADOP family duplicated permease [Gemmatimonadaceae bacterium]